MALVERVLLPLPVEKSEFESPAVELELDIDWVLLEEPAARGGSDKEPEDSSRSAG